ncbi:glycoside hydrolase family 3 C-terminal domain-containing protein [Curtobacterium flaccumfaciens pv. betae]|nr:glycoside hydrolase family 3 N-terminal domain-containing protein [Curtobacterium flaccumfaciens]MCS0472786.1 glycoside hydrolase family 3 C-terminal domain-containing protein [Curtobacterium flaccumfaciens pv. betae]MCS0475787.1 glycoside hydrolase family 3 C-terminal domain-containing protein [Curtobacterium flaccumfaciens pv. betae]MCS0479648.1 glycoside hydrolase family 3 C-terminal domain-containing protein [Curtobacterium flaccumfaciens pv. betae]MCS0482557.1 glycoside hydrolase family
MLAVMTLDEKVAQLVGYWLDQNGVVAPMQGEMAAVQQGSTLADITRDGIGQFTRVYGTRPVEPDERAAWLWAEQRRLQRETRLGIPALVHEECLTGLAAWKAATFPTPLAWGASFDPELVEQVGAAIGASMRQLGVHQGLAPVLDVIRDPRWGRVDECIAEDPYLVGTVGTAYVRGLQSAGVDATLKHFLGYSASQAGRNHAPVHAGAREVADVYLPPFEMALRDGGARSVMNSYAEIDGVPVAANGELLTDLLRDRLGFDGTVVADYFSVAFLEVMHGIAADRGEAAALALEAGIDVELPTGDAYLAPLVERVRSGQVDEALVDRAVLRVLRQKERLGLLEPDAFAEDAPTGIDLDTPLHQALARQLAAKSLVLLSNDSSTADSGSARGTPVLPLAPGASVAVIGPNADRAEALQGCYSFANHVLASHPDLPLGFAIPTVREAVAQALAPAAVRFAAGCAVTGDDRAGFADAVAVASASDVAVVVVGDQAGLFGRGTVGEGNDTESLDLPGVQRELVEAVVATGTPTVMVLLTGRPYAIGWALDGDQPRPAAVVQAFFPGEGGGLAIADLLTGEASPSGRLPLSLPRSAGAQPFTYLHPRLGGPSDVTAADSTPVRPFGFGLGYTDFAYDELVVDQDVRSDGVFTASVTVRNTGSRDGEDVVQLYGHDVHGSVTRPEVQLLGYARVALAAGESARVRFRVPVQRFAFTDRRMRKVVEPGDVQVWVASHAAASRPGGPVAAGGIVASGDGPVRHPVPGTATERATVAVTGAVHEVTPGDPRLVEWSLV